MTTKVYSLLDRKTREFGQLIVARNEETMVRMLIDTVRGSAGLVDKYPEDFDLFCVGEFDSDSGVLSGNVPVLVSNVALVFDKTNAPQEA